MSRDGSEFLCCESYLQPSNKVEKWFLKSSRVFTPRISIPSFVIFYLVVDEDVWSLRSVSEPFLAQD